MALPALPRPLAAMAVALLCAWLTSSLVSAAQSAPPVMHLHGSVSDSVGHTPLAHTLVSTVDRRVAAFTDNDGRFTLDFHLNPAFHFSADASPLSIQLQSSKPGYFPAFAQVRLPVDGSPVADVALAMRPASGISGHVSTPDWDSPDHVPVNLLQWQMRSGTHTWVQVNGTATDSHGNFQFAGLSPGNFVLVTGQWKEGTTYNAFSRTPFDGYPPVYSGNTDNLDTALQLHLHAGDTQRADLQLHSARFYPVSLSVAPLAGSDNQQIFFIGSRAFSEYSFQYSPEHHTFETALPSGNYHVLVQASGDTRGTFYAERDIQVSDAPVQVGPVTLSPPLSVPVRLTLQLSADTSRSPAPAVELNLIPETQNLRSAHASISREAEQRIDDVLPGRYWVRASTSSGYIAALGAGGVDLSRNALTIGPGSSSQPIDVTISNSMARLVGTVQNDGNALPPDTRVMLLPQASDLNHMVRSEQPARDGAVTFDQLVPGTYSLLALPVGSNPFFLDLMQQPLLPSVPTITIKPGDQTAADIPFFASPPLADTQ